MAGGRPHWPGIRFTWRHWGSSGWRSSSRASRRLGPRGPPIGRDGHRGPTQRDPVGHRGDGGNGRVGGTTPRDSVGALVAVLVVLGLAVGAAIGPSGVSATDRSAGPAMSGSWQPRVDTWLSARHAVVQRPLVGVGPGQFRTATSRYRSIAVAQREGPDRLFTDAHNLLVEYAVTTGLLGLGALIVWLAWQPPERVMDGSWSGPSVCWRCTCSSLSRWSPPRWPSWPWAPSASRGQRSGVHPGERLAGSCPLSSLVACAVGMATVFLVGELDLQRGQFDLRPAPVQQADQLLPAWPRSASLLAQAWLYTGIVVSSQPGRLPTEPSLAR